MSDNLVIAAMALIGAILIFLFGWCVFYIVKSVFGKNVPIFIKIFFIIGTLFIIIKSILGHIF